MEPLASIAVVSALAVVPFAVNAQQFQYGILFFLVSCRPFSPPGEPAGGAGDGYLAGY